MGRRLLINSITQLETANALRFGAQNRAAVPLETSTRRWAILAFFIRLI
jgi:hypothetical protein